MEWSGTSSPEGNTNAVVSGSVGCPAGQFAVRTFRRTGSMDGDEANDIAFTIVIP